MNAFFSRFVLGGNLFLGTAFSGSSAEPTFPLFPHHQPSTNEVSVVKPLPLLLPELPYFQQPFTFMFRQRLSERAVDPLTPATLSSLGDTPGAYSSFIDDTSKMIMLGTVKRTARDWMVGRVLPTLSLYDKPLTELGQGFLVGSLQGIERRDLEPRMSVYNLPNDLTFRPAEHNPLTYSWGIDPFRLDPRFQTIITARESTRVFRLSTSYRAGEASFDVHDTHAFVRLGVRTEYRDMQRESAGFISITPKFQSVPLNFSVEARPTGTVTGSIGVTKRF